MYGAIATPATAIATAEQRAGLGSLLAQHVTRDGFTVVGFRHTGWEPDARWFAFCNLAWGVTLEIGLEKYCESRGAA